MVINYFILRFNWRGCGAHGDPQKIRAIATFRFYVVFWFRRMQSSSHNSFVSVASQPSTHTTEQDYYYNSSSSFIYQSYLPHLKKIPVWTCLLAAVWTPTPTPFLIVRGFKESLKQSVCNLLWSWNNLMNRQSPLDKVVFLCRAYLSWHSKCTSCHSIILSKSNWGKIKHK